MLAATADFSQAIEGGALSRRQDAESDQLGRASGDQPPQAAELASGEYLSRGEDIVIAGPIGTGKTHLAIALGVEAACRRERVLFTRAADLVRSLVEARMSEGLDGFSREWRKLVC